MTLWLRFYFSFVNLYIFISGDTHQWGHLELWSQSGKKLAALHLKDWPLSWPVLTRHHRPHHPPSSLTSLGLSDLQGDFPITSATCSEPSSPTYQAASIMHFILLSAAGILLKSFSDYFLKVSQHIMTISDFTSSSNSLKFTTVLEMLYFYNIS